MPVLRLGGRRCAPDELEGSQRGRAGGSGSDFSGVVVRFGQLPEPLNGRHQDLGSRGAPARRREGSRETGWVSGWVRRTVGWRVSE